MGDDGASVKRGGPLRGLPRAAGRYSRVASRQHASGADLDALGTCQHSGDGHRRGTRRELHLHRVENFWDGGGAGARVGPESRRECQLGKKRFNFNLTPQDRPL